MAKETKENRYCQCKESGVDFKGSCRKCFKPIKFNYAKKK
jgi:hypothetical protein